MRATEGVRDPVGIIAGALTAAALLAAQEGPALAFACGLAVVVFRVGAGLALAALLPRPTVIAPAGSWYGPLTPRESQVAELVAGHTNREIAELLPSLRTADGHMTERGVETHVQNILNKLGFDHRSQIAAWVAERKAAAGSQKDARGRV